ncbi:Glucooligosaccharide oxidase [Amniculicola lignicola CBS 123094]|uniref:Glucooligosaccharide oxidase n=1 Tax=Amniculicola lignicola CBS 123094 TaxID=1392246 RepID=A0A6A5WJM6_9PLEO|nr:Glucooligosaccharide oxidase [Amniculicola lignicola CBS 123094]
MRVASFVLLGALGALGGVEAQSTFEPTDFNITEALVDLGVNITALPQLEGLVERSSSGACSIACSSLKLLYGASKVLSQSTTAYDAFTSSYWSIQQASVDPYCVFQPSSSSEVSIIVLISRLTQCPFALKSGGHGAFAGASSIQGGITVSFKNMKDISLSADKKIASIEPGNTWFDVYTTLQPNNLAVVGGRVSEIGVGGLTLGGGISYFSNLYGWACDNVASYEVVTASGIPITASPTSFSDLYWALRGGGNNFGIVTKFNLYTIPVTKMWGGGRVHLETEFPALMQAWYNLGVNAAQDPNAAQILAFARNSGMNLGIADLQYAKPVDRAPIFNEFFAIPNNLTDNLRIATLPELTQELQDQNPNGLRESYWTATYKLDLNFATYVKDVFFEEVTSIQTVPGLVAANAFQIVSIPILQKMALRGGNPLGLSTASGPLLLVNPSAMWTNAADDTKVLQAYARFTARTTAEAKKRGLNVSYLYMNYASQFQAVVPSYGSANLAKLRTVAQKYDPSEVFQELQPGYFKLSGAPSPSGP